MSLTDAIRELRRPFTPAALKWKVQVNPKDGGRAMLVCYIDARLAAERLNHVCPGEWSDSYTPVDGGMLCTLTVDGVPRSDVGWSTGTSTDIDLKALYSDAFKRAAVKFGVGVSIYALPKSYLKASELKQSGRSWFIPDSATKTLRTAYEKWLKSDEAKVFGAALDHGDSLNAQGDIEADPAQEHADDPKPASRRQPAAQPTAPAPSTDGHSGAKDGSQKVDAESLAQLRRVYNESGATDKDLAWFLVSVGVETLPADPSREDIGAAMKGLTQEQAWKVKDLLEGDDSVPGSGEAS